MEHRSVKRKTRRFFDIPRWMGADQIGSQFNNIKSLVHSMTTPQPPEREETYKQAVKRLKMSEEDLLKRQKQLLFTALFYLALAAGIVLYGVYLFSQKKHMAVVMCLPIASVLLSLSFREHFWYTQLKHKRFGFTFKTWWQALLGSK